MSRQRKLRQVRAWARYINHYAHIPSVCIGGRAAGTAIWNGLFGGQYVHVRCQAKHRFGGGWLR